MNSGQNSYAEAVREQPNFMNPRLNTSTDRVREPVNFMNPRATRDHVNFGYKDRTDNPKTDNLLMKLALVYP